MKPDCIFNDDIMEEFRSLDVYDDVHVVFDLVGGDSDDGGGSDSDDEVLVPECHRGVGNRGVVTTTISGEPVANRAPPALVVSPPAPRSDAPSFLPLESPAGTRSAAGKARRANK